MPTLFDVAKKVIAFAAMSSIACAALGQEPDKPVRVLVGQAAGGSTDYIARLISATMSTTLGQNFVVENRPGASGMIASAAVANAAPDGHTLTVVGSTHARLPALYDSVPYDTIKSFKCVGLIGGAPYVLVVHPSIPVHTLAELIAYLKKTPSFYANPGVGTGQHMAAELLKRQAKVALSEIAYKGSGVMQPDLLSGRVPIAFDNPSSVLAHIQKGLLRPIAVTDSRRFSALPDVPTMAEAGYPDLEIVGWFAMLAPADTPDDAVGRLNKALNKALDRPEVIDNLDRVGSRTMPGTPGTCGDLIAAEGKKWGDIIRSIDIQR